MLLLLLPINFALRLSYARELLRGFRNLIWEPFELNPLTTPDRDTLVAALKQSRALPEVDALSDRDLDRVRARFDTQRRAFEDNHAYLAGHRLVATVPST